jgi:hypothetical protein
MRGALVAAALMGISLSATSSAEAKLIWLQCGEQAISLDSERERFSLVLRNKIHQGTALFSPGQINFEYLYFNTGDGGGGKHAYAIDRKTLRYTKTILTRVIFALGGFRTDTGWKVSATEENPESGQCSIMKTPPTAGNKI